MAKKIEILKSQISKYLNNSDNIFFYYKGRVALYAILKSMNIGKDDEVIIPAYTCVVVPNSIMYLKAKPIYVDICPETYNMDIDLMKKAITPRTKAIICQNTYGLSSNLNEIIDFTKKNNIYTIEDCTHGFGGYYNGNPNGTYCDASFFSTQWNKPFSSGLGGFSLINNSKLIEPIKDIEKNKVKISTKTAIILKLLFFSRRYLLNNFTYWTLMKFYRYLSKKNLVVGSSSGNELKGEEMPEDFLKDYSNVQAKEALKNIKNLDKVLEIRKANAKKYSDFLKNNNKAYVNEKLFENHSFLKYPLLVKDREQFLSLAQNHKIPMGDWFLSPLHPVTENFEHWHLDINQFKNAKFISERMVNIITEYKNTDRVIAFLKQYSEFIL